MGSVQGDGMSSAQALRGSYSPMTGSRRAKLKSRDYMQPGVNKKHRKGSPSILKGANTTIAQRFVNTDPYSA